ncbi:hypothetical protein BC831DRAFT_451228 [Entophlyctis helioformis]|nr:hypothetical protein BC831DRAFT_451228 [Entophlyctis helioformis]
MNRLPATLRTVHPLLTRLCPETTHSAWWLPCGLPSSTSDGQNFVARRCCRRRGGRHCRRLSHGRRQAGAWPCACRRVAHCHQGRRPLPRLWLSPLAECLSETSKPPQRSTILLLLSLSSLSLSLSRVAELPSLRWLADTLQYVPSLGEPVVATVVSRHVDDYRVDIGGPHPASLPVLAFEGATKRNRPNLEVGALVYARISLANKDMEPEVECTNPSSGRADGFGELKGGFVVKCSLGMCRSLMAKDSPVLAGLANSFPFETAVGMNGRVWINADTPRQIITIANIIRAADGAAPERIPAIVKAHKKLLDDDNDPMDQ